MTMVPFCICVPLTGFLWCLGHVPCDGSCSIFIGGVGGWPPLRPARAWLYVTASRPALGYFGSNSMTFACATPTSTVLVGYQVDSGARPPSVPVITNWCP